MGIEDIANGMKGPVKKGVDAARRAADGMKAAVPAGAIAKGIDAGRYVAAYAANGAKGAVSSLPGTKDVANDIKGAVMSGNVTQTQLKVNWDVIGKGGAVMPEPFRGRGYFNSSTGISAGHAAVLAEARKPFTSVDAQGRENVDVTAPGYHEAMDRATTAYQPQYKSSGNVNPMWTMPYKDREAIVQDIQAAGCLDETALRDLMDQAGTFGAESLTEQERAIVERGPEAWKQASEYMGALGYDAERLSGSAEPIPDTGRYVKLRSPEGTTSGMLMELAPRMDVHYFVDLEMPEGQAQILALKEGAYEVAWEFEDSPLVRDGIQAARDFQDTFGHIPDKGCGRGDLAVSMSDLYAEARRVGNGPSGSEQEQKPEAEPVDDSRGTDGPDAGNEPGNAPMTEGQKALAALGRAVEDGHDDKPDGPDMGVPGE